MLLESNLKAFRMSKSLKTKLHVGYSACVRAESVPTLLPEAAWKCKCSNSGWRPSKTPWGGSGRNALDKARTSPSSAGLKSDQTPLPSAWLFMLQLVAWSFREGRCHTVLRDNPIMLGLYDLQLLMSYTV